MKKVIVFLCLMAFVGCGGGEKPAKVSLEFRFLEESPGEGLTPMTMDAWGNAQTLYAHDQVVMDGSDVASATVIEWQNRPAIELMFTDSGRDKLAQVTAANVGRRMGMILDGKLIVAPVIRTQMDGGRAVISGDFTDEEAKRVAEGLTK